jgi:hypothetical protein
MSRSGISTRSDRARLLRHPLGLPIAVTLLLLVAYAGFGIWSRQAGAEKLSRAGLGPAPYDIEVILAFAPESFHMTRLQSWGRIVEVRGTVVHLKDVSAAAARDIAGEYWVSAIRRAGR